jgi:hypothetical protein
MALAVKTWGDSLLGHFSLNSELGFSKAADSNPTV